MGRRAIYQTIAEKKEAKRIRNLNSRSHEERERKRQKDRERKRLERLRSKFNIDPLATISKPILPDTDVIVINHGHHPSGDRSEGNSSRENGSADRGKRGERRVDTVIVNRDVDAIMNDNVSEAYDDSHDSNPSRVSLPLRHLRPRLLPSVD